MRDLGLPIYVLNGHFCREEREGVEVRSVEEASGRTVTYETPVGTLTQRFLVCRELHEQGIGAYQTEHLLRTPDDYDVLRERSVGVAVGCAVAKTA